MARRAPFGLDGAWSRLRCFFCHRILRCRRSVQCFLWEGSVLIVSTQEKIHDTCFLLQDSSRGLATMSLKPEDQVGDLTGLSDEELKVSLRRAPCHTLHSSANQICSGAGSVDRKVRREVQRNRDHRFFKTLEHLTEFNTLIARKKEA